MSSESNEVMDPYFSLFNLHVNDAGERARAAFIKRFGVDVWRENIGPDYESGVMAIMQKPPTEFTKWFVETIWVFVNENRVGSLGSKS